MDDIEGIRDYLKEIVNREIVMKYLFIKSMEKNYDDEYLTRKYKIDVLSTRKTYNELEQKDRDRIEKEIKAKVEAGEIDLNREAVRWHREGLKKEYVKNRISENKEKGE